MVRIKVEAVTFTNVPEAKQKYRNSHKHIKKIVIVIPSKLEIYLKNTLKNFPSKNNNYHCLHMSGFL